MRIYRPTFKRDGKRHESLVWWVQFSVRKKKYRRSLGTRDQRAAEQKAADLVTEMERAAVGLGATGPFDAHNLRPLSDHVQDFASVLGGKSITAKPRSDE